MAIARVFKSQVQSIKYIFKNGKEAPFVFGKYYTDNATEIAELEQEIALGHPQIFIDSEEKEVDTEKMDPLSRLREKIIAEYLEEQAKQLDPSNDFGNTLPQSVKPASSSDVAAASAGGAGSSAAAKLFAKVGK